MVNLSKIFSEGSTARDVAETLETRPQLPPLLAGEPFDLSLSSLLQSARGETMLGTDVVKDTEFAEAVRSGLFLWNDDFEASHEVAQDIHNPTGSYWHAICHRREGERGAGLTSNLDNARYWMRRVGEHPIHRALYGQALALLKLCEKCQQPRTALERKEAWDPMLMVDWIQSCETGPGAGLREVLEAIQASEMRLLLEFCATGAMSE